MMSDHDPSPFEYGRPREKWGDAALPGWQALPDVLLKQQTVLGLSATDMLVAINLLSYWWYADSLPFPRVRTIADRMGVTARTVQRSIQKLIEKGYFEKKIDVSSVGAEREVLDPSGLAKELQRLAKRDTSYHYRKLKERERGVQTPPF